MPVGSKVSIGNTLTCNQRIVFGVRNKFYTSVVNNVLFDETNLESLMKTKHYKGTSKNIWETSFFEEIL